MPRAQACWGSSLICEELQLASQAIAPHWQLLLLGLVLAAGEPPECCHQALDAVPG